MNKQDIQKLIHNTEAFQFWPTEWQKWAVKNHYDFRHLNGDKCAFKFADDICYQLRADYELPEEKWWYCNHTPHRSDAPCLHNGDGLCSKCIKVPANLLEYVRECLKRDDIGEFELRLAEEGEEYMSWSTSCSLSTAQSVWGEDLGLRFVRKKKAGWKEYEIVTQDDVLTAIGLWHRYDNLSEAIAYATDHGMCPQFAYKEFPGWSTMPNLSYEKKPATLVKMRVWEGE